MVLVYCFNVFSVSAYLVNDMNEQSQSRSTVSATGTGTENLFTMSVFVVFFRING